MRCLNLVDSAFIGHETSTVNGKLPPDYRWLRGDDVREDVPTVYTNADAFQVIPKDPSKAYAWIFESIEVMPGLFILFPQLLERFNKIFTYYEPFEKMWPDKVMWLPAMDSWVKNSIGTTPPAKKILADNKPSISMICSPKVMTSSQVLRHNIAANLHKYNKNVDVYGPEFRPLKDKQDALLPYHFSIVMENGIQPGYFTEKILDAIACNTVPIYYGDTANMGETTIRFNDWVDGKIELTIDLYNKIIDHLDFKTVRSNIALDKYNADRLIIERYGVNIN